ncbi:MAG: FAD-dependent oxidoreductase [Casimicrobiaceae bacterium]
MNDRPPEFAYRRPPELDDNGSTRRPVIIVGAGPVGLTLALDWAQRGHSVLVLAAGESTPEGSRAICFAKRSIEIFDRLGCGDPVVDKGVSWNLGKVFLQDRLLYEFDLLPDAGHQRPAFVNIQQFHVEHFLLAELARRAAIAGRATAGEWPAIDVRWNNRVTAVAQNDDGVAVTIQCPDGTYTLSCDWLVACDGAGSPVRKMLGLKSEGQVFQDRFLIVDVTMRGPSLSKFEAERRFWFDPPFHRNQSALLHRQADDVWRIDFQLGWQADPDLERQPERVNPRIRAMLGDDVDFSIVWVSVYTFQCRRMDRFVHGKVVFAGDSAHQVSPFGARGANSGIQDADNLGWKLDLIVRGIAPSSLLDSYNAERVAAAEENIRNSTRSTDFITPKSEMSRMFRDATLELAAKYPFARRLVNSGRLSVASHHADSALNTPDIEPWPADTVAPGSPALDAPIVRSGTPGWLLQHFHPGFIAIVFAAEGELPDALIEALRFVASAQIPVNTLVVTRDEISGHDDFAWLRDVEGIAFARYAPQGDAVYLLRPDQHVVARRRGLSATWIGDALRRACMTDIVFNAGVC